MEPCTSSDKLNEQTTSIKAEIETNSVSNAPPEKKVKKVELLQKSPLRRRSSEISTAQSEETLSPDKVWRHEDDSTMDAHVLEQQKAQTKKEDERKLMALICHFQEDQLNRFEDYRRASFPKTAIRRIMQSVVSCPISQNIVIAMAGIAKVFVGEIIEEALNFKEKKGEDGPLQPKHIREAVRKFKNRECLRHFQSRNPIL